MNIRTKIALTLIADILFVALAVLNVVSLSEKPSAPCQFKRDLTIAASNVPELPTGARITSINGVAVSSSLGLDYVLSHYKASEKVDIGLDNAARVPTTLVRRYDWFYIFTYIFVGSVFLLTGILIFFKYPDSRGSSIFHWLVFAAAGMVVMPWACLATYGSFIDFALWTTFDLCAVFVPPLFYHYTFLFPRELEGSRKFLVAPFYAFACIIAALALYYQYGMHFGGEIVENSSYILIHSEIMDIFLMLGLILGVGNLENKALRLKGLPESKNIYWAMLGISIGPLVYVFLMLVPRVLMGYELVPEYVMQYSLVLAPIMFFVSIVNYKIVYVKQEKGLTQGHLQTDKTGIF